MRTYLSERDNNWKQLLIPHMPLIYKYKKGEKLILPKEGLAAD